MIVELRLVRSLYDPERYLQKRLGPLYRFLVCREYLTLLPSNLFLESLSAWILYA